jgi:hypothetical protein
MGMGMGTGMDLGTGAGLGMGAGLAAGAVMDPLAGAAGERRADGASHSALPCPGSLLRSWGRPGQRLVQGMALFDCTSGRGSLTATVFLPPPPMAAGAVAPAAVYLDPLKGQPISIKPGESYPVRCRCCWRRRPRRTHLAQIQ